MHLAVSHLRNMVVEVASLASEDLEIGPNFPVDFSPGNAIGLSNEGDELLKIPTSIDYMFGSDLSIVVNIGFSLAAVEDFTLTHRKQLIAVGTLVQIVRLLLQ